MKIQTLSGIAVITALGAFGGFAHAQETQTQTQTQAEMEAAAEAQMEAQMDADAQAELDTDVQADVEATTDMQTDALQGVEPMVPVGPAVVPVKKVVKQVGPAVVPVAPVEKLQAVETVTLNTANGPVVVVSFPGTVPDSAYNIDFSALDSNADGFISKTEVSASSSEAAHNLELEFEVADDNGDGRLAFTEVIAWVY